MVAKLRQVALMMRVRSVCFHLRVPRQHGEQSSRLDPGVLMLRVPTYICSNYHPITTLQFQHSQTNEHAYSMPSNASLLSLLLFITSLTLDHEASARALLRSLHLNLHALQAQIPVLPTPITTNFRPILPLSFGARRPVSSSKRHKSKGGSGLPRLLQPPVNSGR
jgi:hypothetical protein